MKRKPYRLKPVKLTIKTEHVRAAHNLYRSSYVRGLLTRIRRMAPELRQLRARDRANAATISQQTAEIDKLQATIRFYQLPPGQRTHWVKRDQYPKAGT